LFAGDQPAIKLVANGGNWKIVARLYYDRVAVMVPPNSPIEGIKDLKRKTVASPFGAIALREAPLEQQAADLNVDKDVNNENLDILEIRRRVLASAMQEDAAAQFEDFQVILPSIRAVETIGPAGTARRPRQTKSHTAHL
jgi:ABC-type nitrate/sulfonate/bicarbonate transport system substrate-binding protein